MLRTDPHAVLWWITPVECQSALYRAHRGGALPSAPLRGALTRLGALVEDFDLVAPTLNLRERAGRVLGAHPLRAADALQLAAALAWCDEAPQGAGFVCLDDRLRTAARAEGFTVLPE
jgi:predicted nucleic acid-binding protein